MGPTRPPDASKRKCKQNLEKVPHLQGKLSLPVIFKHSGWFVAKHKKTHMKTVHEKQDNKNRDFCFCRYRANSDTDTHSVSHRGRVNETHSEVPPHSHHHEEGSERCSEDLRPRPAHSAGGGSDDAHIWSRPLRAPRPPQPAAPPLGPQRPSLWFSLQTPQGPRAGLLSHGTA